MDRTHFLVRIIYQPRVLIYGLSAAITASGMHYDSPSVVEAGFCLFLLIYPHVAFRLMRRYFNGANYARYSLLVDAVLVGLLIIVNELHLMASVSFVAALVMSTLVVAGPGVLTMNLGIIAIAVAAAAAGNVEPYGEPRPVTDALSALAVVVYGGLVGHIGFNETVSLIRRRAGMSHRQRKLETMTDRLRRYISPQVFSSLTGEESVSTRRRRLTVFFSDIEGFTRLMDCLPEETVTRLLNQYLDEMAAIALAWGGTVDKFMGDGVMVFYGDPVSRGAVDDALACVRMAIAMRDRVRTLRRYWPRDLHIRVGIHTGWCAVGNFGAEHRMDYTIVGGTVNLASRLERLARRDEILISAQTRSLVRREVACTGGRAVKVKGIEQPVTVYSVTDMAAGSSGTEPPDQGVPCRGTGKGVIRLLDHDRRRPSGV